MIQNPSGIDRSEARTSGNKLLQKTPKNLDFTKGNFDQLCSASQDCFENRVRCRKTWQIRWIRSASINSKRLQRYVGNTRESRNFPKSEIFRVFQFTMRASAKIEVLVPQGKSTTGHSNINVSESDSKAQVRKLIFSFLG